VEGRTSGYEGPIFERKRVRKKEKRKIRVCENLGLRKVLQVQLTKRNIDKNLLSCVYRG
jgi:hypothetical protein